MKKKVVLSARAKKMLADSAGSDRVFTNEAIDALSGLATTARWVTEAVEQNGATKYRAAVAEAFAALDRLDAAVKSLLDDRDCGG